MADETAVSPVIQGEAVHIPTPAWGVPVPERIETVEGELLDDGEGSGSATREDIPDAEWTPAGRRWLGWVSLGLAVATAVLTGIAVSQDSAHHPDAAAILAWVAIGSSVAALLSGLVAAVLNRGRVAGVLGVVVGVFADPWVLLQVLSLLRG